jgi:endonuclease/exonuclease/phosphatase family metal-dependent hydrolase
VLVRTWNLFHGKTYPPGREGHLDEMIRLAVADAPDVVCLQELPAWGAGRLEEWSGMRAFFEVAAPPRIGPFPSTAALGRRLTFDHALLRAAFTGQANAILLARGIRALEHRHVVLNARRFRRVQARWLGLGAVARLAWPKERRVCQAVRAELPDGRLAVFANLHATSYPADRRLADAELLRAATFADGLAEPGELCVLAGDFNVRREESWTLRELRKPEWGFSPPGPGIDHVLVRGAACSAERRWPEARRRQGDLLLSDHAPVEVEIE